MNLAERMIKGRLWELPISDEQLRLLLKWREIRGACFGCLAIFAMLVAMVTWGVLGASSTARIPDHLRWLVGPYALIAGIFGVLMISITICNALIAWRNPHHAEIDAALSHMIRGRDLLLAWQKKPKNTKLRNQARESLARSRKLFAGLPTYEALQEQVAASDGP